MSRCARQSFESGPTHSEQEVPPIADADSYSSFKKYSQTEKPIRPIVLRITCMSDMCRHRFQTDHGRSRYSADRSSEPPETKKARSVFPLAGFFVPSVLAGGREVSVCFMIRQSAYHKKYRNKLFRSNWMFEQVCDWHSKSV